MITRREKLENMLSADPGDQTLRYMLAMELEKEGDHEQSLKYFSELMEDQPVYVPSFLMAGQQLARLGRVEEAKSVYSKGIDQAREQRDDHAAAEMEQFLAELSAN
jgi:tetratricopeptide (TPR) repeat protein